MNSLTRNLANLSLRQIPLLQNNCKVLPIALLQQNLHTTSLLEAKWNKHNYGPRKWLEDNKIIYPPQKPDEEPRKAVRFSVKINKTA